MRFRSTFAQFLSTLRGQAFAWFVLALVLRLAHLYFVLPSPLTNYPTSDEFEHWALARHLAGGDWFAASWGPYFRPQLFAYVLALLIRLTQGDMFLLHLVQAVFDSLAVACGWLLARHLFSRRAARWGALACALYWPFVHFSATLYMESFALFLQAILLLSLVLAIKRFFSVSRSLAASAAPCPPRLPVGLLLVAGLAAGAMLLTRPTVALALPWLLLCVALAARAAGSSIFRALAAAALCGLMIFLTLLPNGLRNHHVSGGWFWLGGNGSVNFYFANNDRWVSMETVTPGLEWKLFIETPAVEAGIPPDRVARMAWWKSQFLDSVRRHPADFLFRLYQKTLLFWNTRAIPCTANFAALAGLSPLQRWLPGFGLLGPFALTGLLLAVLRLLPLGPRTSSSALLKCGMRNVKCGMKSERDEALSNEGGVADEYVRAPRNNPQSAIRNLQSLIRNPQSAIRNPQSAIFFSRLLVLGYLFFYFAGVVLLHVIERYRMPVLALAFLFSGVFIEELLVAWRRRQLPLVGYGLTALALAALWVNLPLTGPELAHHEQYWSAVNMGTACIGLGRPQEAETHFRRAHETQPHRLEAINQLVCLNEQTLHQPARALSWHQQLLALLQRRYPRYKAIRADELAHHVQLALAARQPAAAEQAARQLVATLPAEPQAYYHLALALQAGGKLLPMRAALQQALKLDPSNAAARQMLK